MPRANEAPAQGDSRSDLQWRRSSFTDENCVELATSADHILVRNSNRPGAGTLSLPPGQLGAWVAGVKAGELDDLR